MMTPEEFFSKLRAYCGLLDASVTSYGRTQRHNLRVGGVRFSAHQVWLAADLTYDEPRTVEHRTEIASRLGLRLVVEDDHDHVEPDGWRRP